MTEENAAIEIQHRRELEALQQRNMLDLGALNTGGGLLGGLFGMLFGGGVGGLFGSLIAYGGLSMFMQTPTGQAVEAGLQLQTGADLRDVLGNMQPDAVETALNFAGVDGQLKEWLLADDGNGTQNYRILASYMQEGYTLDVISLATSGDETALMNALAGAFDARAVAEMSIYEKPEFVNGFLGIAGSGLSLDGAEGGGIAATLGNVREGAAEKFSSLGGTISGLLSKVGIQTDFGGQANENSDEIFPLFSENQITGYSSNIIESLMTMPPEVRANFIGNIESAAEKIDFEAIRAEKPKLAATLELMKEQSSVTLTGGAAALSNLELLNLMLLGDGKTTSIKVGNNDVAINAGGLLAELGITDPAEKQLIAESMMSGNLGGAIGLLAYDENGVARDNEALKQYIGVYVDAVGLDNLPEEMQIDNWIIVALSNQATRNMAIDFILTSEENRNPIAKLALDFLGKELPSIAPQTIEPNAQDHFLEVNLSLDANGQVVLPEVDTDVTIENGTLKVGDGEEQTIYYVVEGEDGEFDVVEGENLNGKIPIAAYLMVPFENLSEEELQKYLKIDPSLGVFKNQTGTIVSIGTTRDKNVSDGLTFFNIDDNNQNFVPQPHLDSFRTQVGHSY